MIEYRVYGDLMIYLKPYSLYLTETIDAAVLASFPASEVSAFALFSSTGHGTGATIVVSGGDRP